MNNKSIVRAAIIKSGMNAPESIKTPQYDHPPIGCYIDESSGSADDCNRRTVQFAQSYGFKFEDSLPDYCPGNKTREEAMSELADEAVSYLNELETRPFMSWHFEDNSLFLCADFNSAREEVEFVSSEDQGYPHDSFRGEWLHVNDRGNATLYVRGEDGKDREVWSVV